MRVLLFGLGPIGCGIGRYAAARPDIEIIGAVDSAPDKSGRSLYDVLEIERPSGSSDIQVSGHIDAALANTRPPVVLHATGSYLPDVQEQLLTCARAGANVVSTCEELSFPWKRHPGLAAALDAEAKARGVTLLGTGVNPGFVMDTLAVALTGVCQRIERVTLTRIVDVARRRPQLQCKVGMGLTLEEFQQRVTAGKFGHVGLPESCWLVAAALGWNIDRLDETIEPVQGEGGAIGMRQTAIGRVNGRIVIEATVQMSAGADRPRDEIMLEGTPPVRMVIEGGVQGDTATAAIVANAVPRVAAAAPGLITMLDLPPVASRGV